MPADKPQVLAELEALSPLIGRWATEGETVDADEPSIRIVGTDEYRWLCGGHFIEHRVHVRMGDSVVEALEVIGGLDGSGYAMRSFDHEGNVGTMRATIDPRGVMTFAGGEMRATLEAAPDGQAMKAHWQRKDEHGEWLPWMEMRFTRI